MVINNPEWLELTKEVESFMVNGLIMSNQTNATIVNPQAVVTGHVNDWSQSLTQTPTPKVQTTPVTINNNNNNQARAVLIPRTNSHPFQPRTLFLNPNDDVKVGRSLARSRSSESNAIFDCKVLSRNHAVIWYGDGKFFIKDTGSSNGTFINNQRLSSGSIISEPFEVCSNDIVQFGVDVTENTRKETHGCIVATLKLFLPDGRETKSNSHPYVGTSPSNIPPEDLCRLNQYIQEAVQREQILETKLLNLQKIIDLTRKNSSSNWQAMIDEDRLLSRIDLLESKLRCFQKNCAEDKLREEILKLQEDKSDYQNSAKEALRKVYQERSEALQKLATLERALCSSEDECSLLRDQLCESQQSLQEVTARLSHMETDFKNVKDKIADEKSAEHYENRNLVSQLKDRSKEYDDLKDKVATLLKEKEELLERVTLYQYYGNLTSSHTEDEDDTTEVLNQVKNMLTNSDMNDSIVDDDDESCKVTNNISEMANMFLKKNIFEDRYNMLKKKLAVLESTCTKEPSDDSDSMDITSDGNQNVDHKNIDDESEKLAIVKEMKSLSWIISIILKSRTNFANENGNIETTAPTLQEEAYKKRIAELENMLISKSNKNINERELHLSTTRDDELETESIDGSIIVNGSDITDADFSRDISEDSETVNTSIFVEKVDFGSQTCDELESLTMDDDDEKPVNKKSSIILSATSALSTPTSNTSHVVTTIMPSLSLDDADDLAILNDPKVQNEEELIIFKEKFNDITHENFKLKQDIVALKNSYEHLRNRSVLNFMLYLSPIIVLIAYLLIAYL